MPFVKLDCGMLNSSIWFEREQRELFITALLMARPFFSETEQAQLRVDALDRTGFRVPSGPYGLVEACGTAIIRLACVEQDKGFVALAQLGEPDKDSRSKEWEGRRMIRISGGYLILNYFKYREYDQTGAERQKKYRAKQRAARNVTRDVTDVTGDSRVKVTQAEAEADTEEEGGVRVDGEVVGEETGSSKGSQSRTPSNRASPVLMTQEKLEELAQYPAYSGIDVTQEALKFNQWCDTNKKPQTVKRFVNWLNRVV